MSMGSASDTEANEISISQTRGNVMTEFQENKNGEPTSEDGCQKQVIQSNNILEHENHLREDSNNINRSENLHGQFDVQNTVEEGNDNATCETTDSSQPIIEVEGGQKEK